MNSTSLLTVIVILTIPAIVVTGLLMLIRMNRPTVTNGAKNVGHTQATAGANPAVANTRTVSSTSKWVKMSLGAGVILLLLSIATFGLQWPLALFGIWTAVGVGTSLSDVAGSNLTNLIIWGALAGAILVYALGFTNITRTTVKGVRSIPFMTIVFLGAFILILFPIAKGIGNWFSGPERTQTVEFRSTNFANAVGRRQTITVGPLQVWRLDAGIVTGGNNLHPDGYWVCASTNLNILGGGRVIESRRIGTNLSEHKFTEAARLLLVQNGVGTIEVTYTQQIGRPGRRSPCDQVTVLH